MGKRANTDRAEKATDAKKVKNDPILKKCREVVAVLVDAGRISNNASACLHDAVPLALGIPKDERHEFQARIVTGIGQELAEYQTHLEGRVAEEVAKVANEMVKKQTIEAAVAGVEESLNAKREVHNHHKGQLATSARAFQAAKTKLAEAERDQVSGDFEANELEAKTKDIEVALDGLLRPLLAGTIERSETTAKSTLLMSQLSKFMKLDDSLACTVPLVLAKNPSERGKFDNMAAQKVEEDVASCLESFRAQLAEAEPGRARRSAVVEAAQRDKEVAKQAQAACAQDFIAARKEMEEATQGVADARKTLKESAKEYNKAVKMKEQREAEFQLFRDGPVVTFHELQERTTPPVENVVAEDVVPAAPVQVATNCATEAAGAESNPVADAEMVESAA